jgi:hypothetical protein
MKNKNSKGTTSMGARPRNRGLADTVVFFFIAVVVAAGLLYAGRKLYELAAQPSSAYYTKLGELTLQLAIIVIVGALIKAAIDWGTTQRARHLATLEMRMDFMRRVRAVHVTIASARDLLNAHRSPKTYGEQLRRLMELSPEVVDIQEDLKASPALFKEQEQIMQGLTGIIEYLDAGRQEYVVRHSDVADGYKANQTLQNTIEKSGMQWVKDFMDGGANYHDKYALNLIKAKVTMRSEIYGGSVLANL